MQEMHRPTKAVNLELFLRRTLRSCARKSLIHNAMPNRHIWYRIKACEKPIDKMYPTFLGCFFMLRIAIHPTKRSRLAARLLSS
jgi:hypothetical protein